MNKYNYIHISYIVKLFVLCEYLISMFFEDFLFSEDFYIWFHHFWYHLRYSVFTFPSKFLYCKWCISEKKIDFSRTEISWIHFDETNICSFFKSSFIHSDASPFKLYSYFEKCPFNKLTNRIRLTRSKDKICRCMVLEHEPHTFHIVLRMSPVSLRIEVSNIQFLQKSQMNLCDCTSNLACDECLTSDWRFVIKKESVRRKHSITFSIIYRNPIRIQLSHSIWASWMKRRKLSISSLWHIVSYTPEHFWGRCLIKTSLLFQAVYSYRFEKAKCAKSINIRSILWHFEAHFYVRLSREIIYLIWLYICNQLYQIPRISEVTIVKLEVNSSFMGILIEMIDSTRIEWWRSSLDTMYFISLREKQFSKIRSVLSSNSCDKCFFHRNNVLG